MIYIYEHKPNQTNTNTSSLTYKMDINRRPPSKIILVDNYLVRQDSVHHHTYSPPHKTFLDYVLCRTRF